jgi:hypothetical protein
VTVIFVLITVVGPALAGLGAWWWTARRYGAAGPSPTAARLEAMHAAMRLDAATYMAERYMDDFIQRRSADRDWRWPS